MQVDVSFALLLTTLAGLSTGIGSSVAFFIRRPKYSYLAVMLGFSAGVMIYVSFAELLSTAISEVGFTTANLGFFIGIVFLAIVDLLIPHEYQEEHVGHTANTGHRQLRLRRGQPSVLMRAGVFTAVGIAIHNFPEGLATFSAAATGKATLAITVAIAIAIHNIPEGIIVSLPIFYATGSSRRAFLYSFSSGLAEPVGALIGYAILLPFLTPTLFSTLLAFAAGVMLYISLDELLPLAHQYGRAHLVIIGISTGMLVMAISLYFLR